ncbi:hypothetical protein CGZ98_03400 [Enemella evansiae]|nr:hypothetical protein CGZ98_03400 [Enemella evansiae]
MKSGPGQDKDQSPVLASPPEACLSATRPGFEDEAGGLLVGDLLVVGLGAGEARHRRGLDADVVGQV